MVGRAPHFPCDLCYCCSLQSYQVCIYEYHNQTYQSVSMPCESTHLCDFLPLIPGALLPVPLHGIKKQRVLFVAKRLRSTRTTWFDSPKRKGKWDKNTKTPRETGKKDRNKQKAEEGRRKLSSSKCLAFTAQYVVDLAAMIRVKVYKGKHSEELLAASEILVCSLHSELGTDERIRGAMLPADACCSLPCPGAGRTRGERWVSTCTAS